MILLYLLDAVLIYLSFYLGYYLRFENNVLGIVFPEKLSWDIYSRSIPVPILVTVFFLSVYSLYNRRKDYNLPATALSVTKAVFWSVFSLSALTFFYRTYSFSRIALLYSGFLMFAFLLTEKLLFHRFFIRKRKILIIGESEEAFILEESLSRSSRGLVTRRSRSDLDGDFDEIIIADTGILKSEYEKISEYVHSRNAVLKVSADSLNIPILPKEVEIESGLPILNYSGGLYVRSNRVIKRIFDIAAALFLSILSLPAGIIISLAILIDSGWPMLYFQERVGYRGKKFRVLKFRTMIRGAEILRMFVHGKNEADGKIFKIKEDPRLTRTGRIIRKFYLDELPQLINVLFGNMSLIGPRPLPESDIKESEELPRRRNEVLPGITGLWQIHTDKKLSFNAMVRLDLYYIDNWSLFLDIRIFLDTIPLVMFGIGGC